MPGLRRVDLHLHTTASDGGLAPRDLVQAARAGRLDIIAVADHDTAAGVTDAVAEAVAAGDVRVVPAVEVSSTLAGQDLHVLGYFIDAGHAALARYAARAAERRRERLLQMAGRLRELGLPIADEEVAAVFATTGSPGRPHLARILVERGWVRSHAEAFERYLGDAGPAFVPVELLTPAAAIALIRETGGAAVWAHPPPAALERELPRLVSWGLAGLECFRPRALPEERNRLLAAARAHGLVASGGSDWHGLWQGPLGDFAVGEADVRELLAFGEAVSR
jgi:3',5'-nucleoside bisphosphate phosphatase